MLTGIHFLLTYKCIYECDHCFVYSSPQAEGTFTFEQICKTLDEARKIGTVEWIYFEGGEPFLYYPLLIEGLKKAHSYGFNTGVVSNAYFATSVDDAARWLMPLKDIGVKDLSISDDLFHNEGTSDSPSKIAIRAAKKIGLSVGSISICEPEAGEEKVDRKKGEPVVGGDVMFRGRAADKLAKDLPRVSWEEFNECPYEELVNPQRVHVDAFGHVHICQGISMGNMWEIPLAELIKNYDVNKHPICKMLVEGGPVKLTEEYKVGHEESYLDACHLCYETRKRLLDKFPNYLAPNQVYGI